MMQAYRAAMASGPRSTTTIDIDALTSFLLVCIGEDEAAANVAAAHHGAVAECDPAALEHIQRHDPERVLRGCSARRWIIELADGNVTILLALAVEFYDHPACRPEWRPWA